ncbi:MAG TPA: NAD-dependent epimerase/dehydratase family protein [Thermoleophilaceae bacterium]|nr:NAD-dependent epimerase/dehydratase family protein [Thermoleophilaceae bacterium]
MPHDRVVVTGGLGFIGARLCETLRRQGRSVVCVDDLSGRHAPANGATAAARLRALGAEVWIADAGDAPLDGAHAVVHLAGRPGVRTRRPVATLFAANVELTERLLHRTSASGARFVLASTSSVYGNPATLPTPENEPPTPLNRYAASKLAAERAVSAAAARGADALIVRLFTVYGPAQRPDMAFSRWIRALAEGRSLPWYGAPATTRDFTYLDDAAEGLVAALDRGRPRAIYNVSGGCPVALTDALALVEEMLGRTATLDRVRPAAAEALVTHACLRRSHGELGYTPRVGLEDGLRRQLATALSSPRPGARGRAPAAPRRSGRGSGGAARGLGSPLPAGLPSAASSPG